MIELSRTDSHSCLVPMSLPQVKAGCQSIITYNTRDFAGVEQFGLNLLEPSGFLRLIGKLP
jgi:hypothetical protein